MMKPGFASLHPFVCFTYYLILFLFSMLFLHPSFLITLLVGVIILNLFHDQGRNLKRSIPFFLAIGLIPFLVNPLLTHRGSHMLFYFLGKPITFESILYGLVVMLSLVTIMAAFSSYNHVITADKFLFLFARFSPKVALLGMMAARFVPLLKIRFSELAMIQRTRGLDPQSGSMKKRASEGMTLLGILLSSSLEEAMQTADSVKARGYGTCKRTVYFPYKMSSIDWWVLSFIIVSGSVAFIGWIFGYGRLEIYPKLESIWFTSHEWIPYIAICLFLCIPLAVEGREVMRWHLLK